MNIDLNMIYAIGFVVAVLGVIGLLRYLNNRKIIKVSLEDLLFVVTAFNLTMNIVDELDLKNEPQLKTIGDVVNEALQTCIDAYGDDANMADKVYAHVIGLCEKFGVELNDNRIKIVKTLINLGLEKAVK